MHVVQAGMEHLASAADLFNQYRQFYEQADDIEASTRFLQDNLEQKRSEIFLMLDEQQQALAFAQLYPSFCSIALQRYYILFDLFVIPTARKQGHAATLLHALAEHARSQGAHRLTLETAHDNCAAQALYEANGYQRDEVFRVYHRLL